MFLLCSRAKKRLTSGLAVAVGLARRGTGRADATAGKAIEATRMSPQASMTGRTRRFGARFMVGWEPIGPRCGADLVLDVITVDTSGPTSNSAGRTARRSKRDNEPGQPQSR